MKKINIELHEILTKYFPFVYAYKESIDKEINEAEAFLKPYLNQIKGIKEELFIQVIACLIKNIRENKKQLDERFTKETFKSKGKSFKKYHKMIYEFNRVMQSFYNNTEAELEAGGKIFPIKKIRFEGLNKDQLIELEGEEILSFISTMFLAWNNTYGKEDLERMKDYSFELHESYQKFSMQWQILNSEKGTLATTLVNTLQEENIETAWNKYKFKIAYCLSEFMKAHFKKISNAEFPASISMFIGMFFTFLNIDSWELYLDNKKISNYIKRGKPIESSRTKDSQD